MVSSIANIFNSIYQVFLSNMNITQSAGAVEYTDCTPAEG